MRTLLRRINTLERHCRVTDAREQRCLRIIVRDVNTQIGLGKATCQRTLAPGGNVTEIINFYGCPFGEGEPRPEEEAFTAWINTVPVDGVMREYRPEFCCR
jgi:hypothetical protein